MPIRFEHAYAASVGNGAKTHAVVLDELPPSATRSPRAYSTVCHLLVGGHRVYALTFEKASNTCKRCYEGLVRSHQPVTH